MMGPTNIKIVDVFKLVGMGLSLTVALCSKTVRP